MIFREWLRSLVDLIYPPECIHCRYDLDGDSHVFCSACLEQIELIDPAYRCPHCFAEQFEGKACHRCRKQDPICSGVAAAFEYEGPMASVVRQLKYASRPYLAKGAGAYIAAQWTRLGWPTPDAIVPIPVTFSHWLVRGYNQSQLLAESFASIIDCPIYDILKKRSEDFSQAGLTREQRLRLAAGSIGLRKEADLAGKRILLIDDVMTSGATLKRCAQALYSLTPEDIYFISVCRA